VAAVEPRAKRDRSAAALRRLAREVRRMFAPHIDVRDLQQAGALGLMKAAQGYDPALGRFEPYAYFRIRGAMIDSQKRRAYRNEACVSLQAMYEANGNWLR
jgi:RNA polymerase sigma factor (sigma-70 family)